MASESALGQTVSQRTSADQAILAERREDVAVKQQRVAEFLEDKGYEALLLETPESFAWFTSGGDNSHGAPGPGCAALFVTAQERYLLASRTEAGRLLQEEVGGLGLHLRQGPWEKQQSLYEELCGNRKVASDTGVGRTENVWEQLCLLRVVLTVAECHRSRDLGRDISQALESTARAIEPGMTEADVAAELAHWLTRRSITPVELLIAADERAGQFRRPVYKHNRLRKRCTLTVTGRRWGLCAGATRQVCFGPPTQAFRKHHTLASMVDATFIFFSRPGEALNEVFRRVKRIYEKFGHANEWAACDQGGVTGYRPIEVLALPDSPFRLAANMALGWCPSVGAARSHDTVLIDEQGFEIVTKARTWPTNLVSVKGYTIERPGILIR